MQQFWLENNITENMQGTMTKNEKKLLDKISRLGCILCSEVLGVEGTEAELHHVRRYGTKRSTSPVLPLISCEELLERVSQKLGKGFA